MDWLNDLIRYLCTQKLIGWDGVEESRLDMMGTTLEGSAKIWFNAEIQSTTAKAQGCTFLSATMALYAHCVSLLSPMKARDHYDCCVMKQDQNAYSFFLELRRLGTLMTEPPSDYDFRSKFVAGLLPMLRNRLILLHNLTAENASIQNLLEKAIQVEKANYSLRSMARKNSKQNLVFQEHDAPSITADRPWPSDHATAGSDEPDYDEEEECVEENSEEHSTQVQDELSGMGAL